MQLSVDFGNYLENRNCQQNRSKYIYSILKIIDPSVNLQNSQSVSKINDFIFNYYNKDDFQVRKNFYDKLFIKQEQNLSPSVKSQCFTIFDWDDTLLPTSYLGRNGLLVEQAEETQNLLCPLDQIIFKILDDSLKYGETFIITNAGQGWVEHSAQRFLPMTFQILEKITVISARTKYESQYPNDQFVWKKLTFNELTNLYKSHIFTNISIIGDSNIEIQSGSLLSKFFINCYLKTVKLKESPSYEELYKQITLLGKKMDQVYMAKKNLTIRLEKKQEAE